MSHLLPEQFTINDKLSIPMRTYRIVCFHVFLYHPPTKATKCSWVTEVEESSKSGTKPMWRR